MEKVLAHKFKNSNLHCHFSLFTQQDDRHGQCACQYLKNCERYRSKFYWGTLLSLTHKLYCLQKFLTIHCMPDHWIILVCKISDLYLLWFWDNYILGLKLKNKKKNWRNGSFAILSPWLVVSFPDPTHKQERVW